MLNVFIQELNSVNDEEDFIKVYYEHEKLILKVTYGILKEQYYAEDAAQDAWFGIARSFHKLDLSNKQMLKGYIITAAKNSAFNILKKNDKHASLELSDYFETEYSVDEEIVSNEAYHTIRSTIMQLSEVYRDVLTLYILNGLSAADIARHFNCSSSTIRSIIRRGKKTIAKKLEEAGLND